MVRLTQILCPVDLSDASSHALIQAVAFARSYQARLTVLEVSWAGLPPIAYPGSASLVTPPLLLPRKIDELRDELRGFAERCNTDGVKTNLVIREGAVVPMILEEAQSTGAELIVMGTHGRSGFDHLLLGSVTEKVLRKARCAVMTVPPADRPAVTAPRVIVCAVDFSAVSLKALGYAMSFAQEWQAALALIHVIDWPEDRMPRGVEVELTAYRAKAQEETRSALQALVPDDVKTWCRVEEQVTIGRPHEEIVTFARDREADLIVMGVHGRSAVSVAVFGSTANQVVRHASCPVVTVRD